MAVRLTSSGVEYDRGFGDYPNLLQFYSARIQVLGTFSFTPLPNTIYGGTTPYDTGIPVTTQVRKNLRLGFQWTGAGGVSGINNAALNNEVYWGFTTGNSTYGNEPTFTYTNGVVTDSRIKIRFYFRSINVTAVSAVWNVKLYTYG